MICSTSCAWSQLDVARHPRADRLADATDYEVRDGFGPAVLRQSVGARHVLARQEGEDAADLGALACQHGIGQLRVEQQPSDAGVAGDGSDQVRDAGPVLLVARRRGDGRLGGGGDVGDHPVEDGGDEFVLVGEALVEVARRDAGLRAQGTDRQLRRVRPRRRAVPDPASSSCRLRCASRSRRFDAAVRPDLWHASILTPVECRQAISGNKRFHI